MNEVLVSSGPDLLDGPFRRVALRLIAHWLNLAMPLDSLYGEYAASADGVYLRWTEGVEWNNWESLAETLAEDFVSSVDWDALETRWIESQRIGEKWELWEIDPELEAKPLTREEFAEGILFLKKYDIDPTARVDIEDWKHLESYLDRAISKSDINRLYAFWANHHPDMDRQVERTLFEESGDYAPPPPLIYKVKVYDNFHYQDEDETYILSEIFDSEESARAECQRMVAASVAEHGYDYKKYQNFGVDPCILPPKGVKIAEHFSAWTYAKELCDAHKLNQADES